MFDIDYVETITELMGEGGLKKLFGHIYHGGCRSVNISVGEVEILWSATKSKISISHQIRCFNCWCDEYMKEHACIHEDEIYYVQDDSHYWHTKVFTKAKVLKMMGAPGQLNLFIK